MIEEKEGLLLFGWTEKIRQQVKALSQWNVQKLELWIGKNPAMLKEISHLHFPRLQELMLNGNDIGSVEGMYRISMPHLQEIELSSNYLRSVRDLRKADWPCFCAITTANNSVSDIYSLTEAYFPRLTYLHLHWDFLNQMSEFPSMYLAVKLPPCDMYDLNVRVEMFSFKRSLERVIKNRWMMATLQ